MEALQLSHENFELPPALLASAKAMARLVSSSKNLAPSVTDMLCWRQGPPLTGAALAPSPHVIDDDALCRRWAMLRNEGGGATAAALELGEVLLLEARAAHLLVMQAGATIDDARRAIVLASRKGGGVDEAWWQEVGAAAAAGCREAARQRDTRPGTQETTGRNPFNVAYAHAAPRQWTASGVEGESVVGNSAGALTVHLLRCGDGLVASGRAPRWGQSAADAAFAWRRTGSIERQQLVLQMGELGTPVARSLAADVFQRGARGAALYVERQRFPGRGRGWSARQRESVRRSVVRCIATTPRWEELTLVAVLRMVGCDESAIDEADALFVVDVVRAAVAARCAPAPAPEARPGYVWEGGAEAVEDGGTAAAPAAGSAMLPPRSRMEAPRSVSAEFDEIRAANHDSLRVFAHQLRAQLCSGSGSEYVSTDSRATWVQRWRQSEIADALERVAMIMAFLNSAPPAPPPCAASIAVVKEQLAELHRWIDRRITS